jgi:SAM-dependent methyltransferase
MVSARLRALVRCPDCRFALRDETAQLACPNCGRRVEATGGYLDLRPSNAFSETTKYTDAALHADARHERVSPPLLGAGVRNAMLRAFLDLGPSDRVVDLGCGSGRMMAWNLDTRAWFVGVDVSPYFAHEALADHDLVLGDLRRLPVPDASFDKAWSLDVFEHLSIDALKEMLGEANRVLVPGGALFVYSHVRKNSRIAGGLRAINALARWLERRGLIDMTQERLRKSDHLNPLDDVPHLERVTAACGFRIARIRYYTPIVGGFVENVLMRMTERWLTRRAAKARGADPEVAADADVREARTRAKARIARGGVTYRALQAITWLMRIDLALFGRVRSGPFFALLVKDGPPAGDAAR